MDAMQYEITLPADYDMATIRRRVAEKGPLLDDLPGLGLKAYLIRERGTDSPGNQSDVNQYAPFYLWVSTEGTGRFLWGGGGFAGLVGSFGRPKIRRWAGIAWRPGAALAAVPATATREIEPVPGDGDPAPAIAAAQAALAERVRLPGVHSAALAVDLERWELVRFTLWEQASPDMPGTRYQVLHLSRPGLAALA